MTVTIPRTLVLFRPILKNSYNQKSLVGKEGSWHLSLKMSPSSGGCRGLCGLVMRCDILTSCYFLIDIDELRSDREKQKFVCKKCLEKIEKRNG